MSHKDENKHLLPVGYKAYNPDAQNGDWQCPVKGCGESYTRKYAVLKHMRGVCTLTTFAVSIKQNANAE